MLNSTTVAPHVTAVFEADSSAIMAYRKKHKAAFEREGANLTFTAYLVAASVLVMRDAPAINSRWHADRLEIFDAVNIGVRTALGDKGVVVPVVSGAKTLSLLGIAGRLTEQIAEARESKPAPANVRGEPSRPQITVYPDPCTRRQSSSPSRSRRSSTSASSRSGSSCGRSTASTPSRSSRCATFRSRSTIVSSMAIGPICGCPNSSSSWKAGRSTADHGFDVVPARVGTTLQRCQSGSNRSDLPVPLSVMRPHMKEKGTRLVAMSTYDYPSAPIADRADIDAAIKSKPIRSSRKWQLLVQGFSGGGDTRARPCEARDELPGRQNAQWLRPDHRGGPWASPETDYLKD